jgi:hypothetical protein
MRTYPFLLATLLATVSPALAQETPADIVYCQTLANTYTHYIGRSEASPYDEIYRGSVDVQVAATQCRPGTVTAATRVLERVLVANGFTLPRR